MTITFKAKDGDIVFKSVDDFNKFWYYEKTKVVLSADKFVIDTSNIKANVGFVRQDGSYHTPKSEVINGELWYVNDGIQPIEDGVKVECRMANGMAHSSRASILSWRISSSNWIITHWRLARG